MDTNDWCISIGSFHIYFSYIEKFTDFLRLFVSIHLRRFESNSQFPVVEFLALLFKYTFRQVRIILPFCLQSFLSELSYKRNSHCIVAELLHVRDVCKHKHHFQIILKAYLMTKIIKK